MKKTAGLDHARIVRIRYLVITVLAFIILLVPAYFLVQQERLNTVFDYNEMANDTIMVRSRLLDAQFKEIEAYLAEVDNHIDESGDYTTEGVLNEYQSHVMTQVYGQPMVIYPDGQGYYLDENDNLTLFDAATGYDLQKARTALVYVSDPYVDSNGKLKCLIYSPIDNASGTLVCFITVSYDLSSLQDYLKPYDEILDSQVFLTNKAGKVLNVSTTQPTYIKNNEVLECDFYLNSDTTATGLLAYHNDVSYYADFASVNNDSCDWYFVIITQKTDLDHLAILHSSYIIVIFAIYTAIIGVVLLSWFYRNLFSDRQMYRLAFVDSVTNRDNRASFVRNYSEAMKSKTAYALISMDVSGFGIFNDTFGFEQGNKLLAMISDIISDNLYVGEYFCREQSDNFLILMKYVDDAEIKDRIGQIGRDLEVAKEKENIVESIPLKYGVTVVEDHFKSLGTYLDCANYAKQNQNGSFFRGQVKDDFDTESFVKRNIDGAIKNEEIFIYLQSKNDINNGHIVGAEALIRWKPRNIKQIFSPKQFISVAEKSGAIVDLDLYVLSEVCKILASWKKAHKPLLPISINFSQVTLFQRDIVSRINQILDEYQVDPVYLEVEVTEGIMASDIGRFRMVSEQLHIIGIQVAIDDFGVGYSSFALLEEANIDDLKLDQTFLLGNSNSSKNKILLHHIHEMCEDFNIRVVVEGIENQAQIAMLNELGFTYGQGYYFNKPMPVFDFNRRLDDNRKYRIKKEDDA